METNVLCHVSSETEAQLILSPYLFICLMKKWCGSRLSASKRSEVCGEEIGLWIYYIWIHMAGSDWSWKQSVFIVLKSCNGPVYLFPFFVKSLSYLGNPLNDQKWDQRMRTPALGTIKPFLHFCSVGLCTYRINRMMGTKCVQSQNSCFYDYYHICL